MVDGRAGFGGIERPYFTSRGLWTLTGTVSATAYSLLKRTTTIVSGTWGTSGVYNTQLHAQYYNDISGISGCIGVNLETMLADNATGLSNVNRFFARRNMSVLHLGIIKLPYVSGTLDGTVVELGWGDRIAPCISGFRAYEEINTNSIQAFNATMTGVDLSGAFGGDLTTTGHFLETGNLTAYNVLNTGIRQQILGTYMDAPTTQTGTSGAAWRKVFMNPEAIYGVHK